MNSKCCCCRYCSCAVLEDDEQIYCEARKELYEGKYVKEYKNCKDFLYNEIDVLNPERKYRKKEPKIEDKNQIKFNLE